VFHPGKRLPAERAVPAVTNMTTTTSTSKCCTGFRAAP